MGPVIWSNWNKADKTLLFVLVVFLFCLCLHLSYPTSLLADGMLFCAEAALVGGLADWFAVTALFEKPLGFPYHTAILPRRRDSFIQSSVTLVQKEFFSKRKIFHHLERLHLMPMLLEWLDNPETKAHMTDRLLVYARNILVREGSGEQAAVIAERFRDTLAKVEPEDFFGEFGRWLSRSGRDHEILAKLASYGYLQVEKPETRKAIEKYLQDYEKERTKGDFWSLLAAGFLEATNLVDLEEAAELMQKQLLSILEELARPESQLQEELLSLFYEKSMVLNLDPAFHQLLHDLKDSLLEDLPLGEAVQRTFTHLRAHLAEDQARDVDPLAEHLPVLQSRLAGLIGEEYQRILDLLKEDEELRRSVGHFLYDLIARSALHAQTLVGVVVTSVLSGLTDKQLNHLVYDKVEPDLLWIRMNGSIVGAGIGLIMFVIMKFIELN